MHWHKSKIESLINSIHPVIFFWVLIGLIIILVKASFVYLSNVIFGTEWAIFLFTFFYFCPRYIPSYNKRKYFKKSSLILFSLLDVVMIFLPIILLSYGICAIDLYCSDTAPASLEGLLIAFFIVNFITTGFIAFFTIQKEKHSINLFNMNRRLSKKDLKLYNAVDQIIWKDWDPIGIYDAKDTTRDEYYNYLPKIFEMIKSAKSKEKISDYLFSVETKSMGLPGNKEKCNIIAQKLLKLIK